MYSPGGLVAPSKFLMKYNLIRALPLLTSAAGWTDRWGHTRAGPGRKTKDNFFSTQLFGQRKKKQHETHSSPSQTRSRPSEFSWDFQVHFLYSFLHVRMELDNLLSAAGREKGLTNSVNCFTSYNFSGRQPLIWSSSPPQGIQSPPTCWGWLRSI